MMKLPMFTRSSALRLHSCVRIPVLIRFLCLWLLAGATAAVSSVSAQPAERPNIVFIFSDDHATQALGAYGGRLAALDPTPNLDRLANEGMLFRNAFVTNSICAPSRAVILSGLHSHLNGVETNARHDSLEAFIPVFPEMLQQGGYRTAIIGKWHLKSDPRGFDYWEVLPGQGDYYNPAFRTQEGDTHYEGYVSDIVTDRALEWLENGRDTDEPFLLMYQHKAPHRNWLPGPTHLNRYDDVEIPAPRSLFYDYSGLSTPAVLQEMEISTDLRWGWDLKLPLNPEHLDEVAEGYNWINRFTPEQRAAWEAAYGPKNDTFYERYRVGALQERDLIRWKYQRYLKDYLRTIYSMDENIGRLLDYLEEAGLAENIIVIYNSDQGFFLGEKGMVRQAVDVRGIVQGAAHRALARRRAARVRKQGPRTEPRSCTDPAGYDRRGAVLADAGPQLRAASQGEKPLKTGANPSTTTTTNFRSPIMSIRTKGCAPPGTS